MPHGGYHGTVKMGGRTVQQASRSDGRGGQTGGGRYRAEGYDEPKSSSQTAAQLTKQIRDQMAADTDARSAYIGAQADSRRLSNLLRQEQEQNLANSVAASFAKGNARKSDFTGNAGDKSFLGINYGSTPTAAATVINPITGEKIVTRKVREGMTSPEYAKYMSGLGNLNKPLMEELFPFASGKTMRNISKFMPGLGTLQTIAGNVFGNTRSFLGDKLSGIMNTSVGKDLAAAPGGFKNDLLTMLGLNKNKKEGATTATEPAETQVLDVFQEGSIEPGQIESMGKSIAPQNPMRFMDMEDILKAQPYGIASLLEESKIKPVMKPKPANPNQVEAKPRSAYEQAVAEYMNTYGPGSDLFQKEVEDGFLDEYKGSSYDQLSPSDREYIQRMIQISAGSLPYGGGHLNEMPQNILERFGTDGGTDYGMFQDSPFRTDNIPADAFSGARSSLLPKAASIIPQAFKEGGEVDTYNTLKLINDTMHG